MSAKRWYLAPVCAVAAAMLLGVTAACGGGAPAAPAAAATPATATPAKPVTPITAVALTADRSAPQAPGTTITWTAVPTGGVAPYQYKWWVSDGKAWSPGADWSSANTFAWTPKLPQAKYMVAVWVRSAGNSADAAELLNQLEFPIISPK